MFYDITKGICQGLKESRKEKYRQHQFDHLRTTPYLHGSDYLTEMMDMAHTKNDYESILEHMYKHEANGIKLSEIDAYANIEKTIIDKYWR
jgi:AAA+ ATPase superfamily predicted ATPase